MWFTDGSKINDDNGAGVYCPIGTEESYPLGKQARHGVSSGGVCDSQVLWDLLTRGAEGQDYLHLFGQPTVTSRLVWEGRERLCDLDEDNGVELRWVPGHSGILGNEADDRLAREGIFRDTSGAGTLSW